jgi:hypothetical protein
VFPFLCLYFPLQKVLNENQIRPSPNERTRMGWHRRLALAIARAQGALHVPSR